MRIFISFRYAFLVIFSLTSIITYAQTNTEKIKAKWCVERFEVEKITPESSKAQQDLLSVYLTFNDKELVISKKTEANDNIIKRGQYSLSGNILKIGEDQADILLLSEQYLTIKIPRQGILYLRRI